MEIEFRQAGEGDLSDILNMMESFNVNENYPFDSAISRKNLKKFIAGSTLGRFWLVRSDHKAIGYIALTFGFSFEYRGRDAFIDELFIKEPYRNKGIGKKAMEFLETEARKLGVKAIHLEVERRNGQGKRLYAQCGYTGSDRALLTKKLI